MAGEELDAIEARATAATEGPWLPVPTDSGDDRSVVVQAGDGLSDGLAYNLRFDDATFIAAARTDVPALVAEVRRLQAENEQLREDFATQRRAAEAIYDAKIGP